MVTDAEMIFWTIAGILALLFVISLPIIFRHMERKEHESMFSRRETNIDDMEDTDY